MSAHREKMRNGKGDIIMAADTGTRKFAKMFMVDKVSWARLQKKVSVIGRGTLRIFCLKPSILNSTSESGIHSPALLSTYFFGAINIQLFTLEMPADKLAVLRAVSVIYIPC